MEWHSCYFVEMLCFKNKLGRKEREKTQGQNSYSFWCQIKSPRNLEKTKQKRKEIIIISIEEFMMPSFFPLSNNIKIHI
jgi:hypothetical protein